jgi:hypothetical protein
MNCVFCELETQCIYVHEINLLCAMTQAVSSNVWRFVVDKVTLQTGFPPSTSVFLCQYRSTNTSFICMLVLPEGQTGEAWEPSKKQCSFGNRETLDIKVFLLLIVLPSVTFRSSPVFKV